MLNFGVPRRTPRPSTPPKSSQQHKASVFSEVLCGVMFDTNCKNNSFEVHFCRTGNRLQKRTTKELQNESVMVPRPNHYTFQWQNVFSVFLKKLMFSEMLPHCEGVVGVVWAIVGHLGRLHVLIIFQRPVFMSKKHTGGVQRSAAGVPDWGGRFLSSEPFRILRFTACRLCRRAPIAPSLGCPCRPTLPPPPIELLRFICNVLICMHCCIV